MRGNAARENRPRTARVCRAGTSTGGELKCRYTDWRSNRVPKQCTRRRIAASFAEASKSYVDNPTALHLRAMNMLFEGLKQKGALVIVPSSAVDTMNLGGLSGMVSLAQNNVPKEEKK